MGEGEDRGSPLRARSHQAALFEASKVLADRALGKVQMRRELADSVLALDEVLQDRQAGPIAETVEQAGSGFSCLGAWNPSDAF